MYSLGLLVLAVATASLTSAAPQYGFNPKPVTYVKPILILKQSQDNNFDGTFNYDFESENGIASSANGYVKQISPKEQAQVMQGQYSYIAPDGTPVVTRWYADETGFHAEGAHLPVAPPVPEAIAKSLAYQGPRIGRR
ncbi:endocuticle structural glycoprotein SgAbd-2-like [Macrosteles quadrilineatus]|uniref:endocuticle structural glycoprotein SgAbd-2-like n=1 Tax=Macrosteles quadrilineatus TaxID=74068 RepID=UPI0023E17BA4|nr:endocuticle structural glycoprotein SgAbd-2-like [Macrosteles quadrilineatus]XP_054262282.1 endocuticle structural glycoprotein SgAbd-2-like [Macrosteles quadrilineatus]